MELKSARIGFLIVGLLAAWCVTPAFAGNSRQVTLRHDATLQGQPIPAGEYKLVWTPNRNPDELEVTLQHGKKVVARASAKRVAQSAPSQDESLVYSLAQHGPQELLEIRFAGSKEVIRIDPPAQARK